MARDFRGSVPEETMNQLRILKGKYGVDTNGELLQELVKLAHRVEESDKVELRNR